MVVVSKLVTSTLPAAGALTLAACAAVARGAPLPSTAGTSKATLPQLLSHFWRVVKATGKGKFLLTCWGSGYLVILAAGAARQSMLAKNKQEKKDQLAATNTKPKWAVNGDFKSQMKKILAICYGSALSTNSAQMAVHTVLLMMRVWLTIKIAVVTGNLGKLVGQRSWDGMFYGQVVFALWCMPAALTNSLLRYTGNNLTLGMRSKLVKFVHEKYLDGMSLFYKASNVGGTVTQLDQRATQDIDLFCTNFVETYDHLLKPLVEVVFVSHTLSKMMGGKYLAGFFGYFFLTNKVLSYVKPNFAAMTMKEQELEGKLRNHHTRIITYAEEIAFYGGNDREKEAVNAHYKKISEHCAHEFKYHLLTDITDQYCVKYGGAMMAFSMLIPAVYLGLNGLHSKDSGEITRYYLTATQLFTNLGTAVKDLVLSYKRIASLKGLTARTTELIEMLEVSHKTGVYTGEKALVEKVRLTNPKPPGEVVYGEVIRFDHVDIYSPSGDLLVRDLTFEVSKGVNVLVAGPNGAGKSSLFRVLAGLWPLVNGKMTRPKDAKLMFYVPQKPFMCVGTLRANIMYPDKEVKGSPTYDKKLTELMGLVNLGHVLEKYGGWDAEQDWLDCLSGGEKQRLAMARLFYHRPAFGILDECTSAVSADTEASIYENCKNLGITIFTVSHRPNLRHHHDKVLIFDGLGGWEFSDIKA